MQQTLNNKAIIGFLKARYKSTGFIDGLKIKYRSLICPFISLIQNVKPGEKAADVGCGSGQFLLLLSRFASPSYLFGIEIIPRLIDNAKALFADQPAGTYGFQTYNGVDFPAELKEMDVVFLVDVLHHVPRPNREQFIRNLAGILKPGARLVLKDINAASPFVYFNKLHDMIFAGEVGHEISMKKARQWLLDAGLDITEEHKRLMYVYPHYTLVASKKSG